ncbi:MAG: AI-2E family transporter [Blautia sp.]|nr:AI-2E family transporter [Blautia sp.]
MENQFWKQSKWQLLFFAIIVALTCLIALAFFRTGIFVKGFHMLLSILTPFVYGFVIAYLLRPVCRWLESIAYKVVKNPSAKTSGRVRLICVLLSLVFLLLLIVWLILAVLPQLVASISKIVSQLPGAVEKFQAWMAGMDTDENSHEIVLYVNEITSTLYERLENFLQTDLLPTMQSAIGKVTKSFMGLVDFLKNFGLGCIISIYFMNSWEKFGMQGKLLVYSLFPRKAAEWIRNEIHFVDDMFSGFIIGKIIDSAIIGVICFIFCSIVHMPYTLLISLVIGVTNIIPFFGPYLGAVPSVLLVLTENLPKALILLVFIIVLQQVDGNVIGPKILGDKLGISSFWILFSILFFGALWGLIGMLAGAPVFAVIYDLIRRGIFRGLKNKDCLELKEQYIEQYKKE